MRIALVLETIFSEHINIDSTIYDINYFSTSWYSPLLPRIARSKQDVQKVFDNYGSNIMVDGVERGCSDSCQGNRSVTMTMYMNKIQKHFQNVILVGMASVISKNYTYKCVDRSRPNGIKGAKAKCAH